MQKVNSSKDKDRQNAKLGVDTGGTFTDFVWIDAGGKLQIHKELSTPADPTRAIISGIREYRFPEMITIIHGSTVGTNALLERHGARTALITTEGFSDVLAIGRQNRPNLYALVPQKPKPLVPKEWRFGVSERISATGEILESLNKNEIEPIFHRLVSENIEALAICLLFSFLMPEHEQIIRDFIRKLESDQRKVNNSSVQKIHISLSSEIIPEFREYERTSTTVINAYIGPIMDRYLSRLNQKLDPRPLRVMQSNGGIISANVAGDQAARTVLSGPAGGVVGARFVAEQAGFKDIISFDMGGTSTDVALCPGRLPKTSEGEISGLPLRLPIIDIQTIGAGGGSIAYVDAGGALKVGPQSAGAEPGPACYQKFPGDGSSNILGIDLDGLRSRTTTTDANLVLGRLDADHFLDGDLRLNPSAASAVMEMLSIQIDVASAEEAAWGVYKVANANMARVIRRISVERGYDPRTFTLVAFGGAGPLHACELAADLQIPRVLIPLVPGVLSALGMLVAKPMKDYSLTVMRSLEIDHEGSIEWLEREFNRFERQAVADMVREGHSLNNIESIRQLDMRYIGQSHELTINVSPEISPQSIANLFHGFHQQRFSYQRSDAPVEVVNLRVIAVVQTETPHIDWQVPSSTKVRDINLEKITIGQKPVLFEQGKKLCSLFKRKDLPKGTRLQGPALIFQYDTTTVIPPGWQATVDSYGNLILSVEE